MQAQKFPKISIITGPVGIGKSTLISHYIQNFSAPVCGFLCDLNSDTGLRKLRLLPTMDCIDFETLQPSNTTQSIGRFHFKNEAFNTAMHALVAYCQESELCIVDEIGRLEIEMDMGFEPAFSAFLTQEIPKHILIVIRSSLLDRGLQKYAWMNYSINQGPWMPQVPELRGVILAGGNSSRMQKDKRYIAYHGMPQWKYAFEQLRTLGLETCISAYDIADSKYPVISDHPRFSNAGPMSGLLSVSNEFEESAILVLGIDYPNMDLQSLQDLIFAFQIRNCSVCYRNPESQRIEPLIAIYHPRDMRKLKVQFGKSSNSLSAFWEASKEQVLVLNHKNSQVLKSYDLPSDEATFRTR